MNGNVRSVELLMMERALVEDLMAQGFPPVHPEDHEWTNIHDGKSAIREVIRAMLARLSTTSNVLVMAGDNVVGSFSSAEAEDIIADQLLQSEIQVANHDFTTLMFVHLNGVATVWSQSDVLAWNA